MAPRGTSPYRRWKPRGPGYRHVLRWRRPALAEPRLRRWRGCAAFGLTPIVAPAARQPPFPALSGESAGLNRIARIISGAGLFGVPQKRRWRYKPSGVRPMFVRNHLERDTALEPSSKWVVDITSDVTAIRTAKTDRRPCPVRALRSLLGFALRALVGASEYRAARTFGREHSDSTLPCAKIALLAG